MTGRLECTPQPGRASPDRARRSGGGARTATAQAPSPSIPATGAKATGSAPTAPDTASSDETTPIRWMREYHGDHIRRLVDTAPPLAPAQRDRIASALHPTRDRALRAAS